MEGLTPHDCWQCGDQAQIQDAKWEGVHAFQVRCQHPHCGSAGPICYAKKNAILLWNHPHFWGANGYDHKTGMYHADDGEW